MFEKVDAKPKLARNRCQTIAPFPLVEDIVDVLKVTEQLDSRWVVHVNLRAQQRPLERHDARIHVGGHREFGCADEQNRDTLHAHYVVARGDKAAKRASSTIPAVGAVSTRQQPGMTLAEEVPCGSIEDFLMGEKAQRFHCRICWQAHD